jgi:hypothetical protein
MTQDEIIEMARQAGAYRRDIGGSIEFLEVFMLERFTKLVAEKEREACATMSDWILKEGGGTWGDAIRKRK